MNQHTRLRHPPVIDRTGMIVVLCSGGTYLGGTIKHSTFILDRDADRANRKDTVADIASGEIENVSEVYEIGRDLPVTEDIAREVLALARKDANGEQLPYGVREFCHEQLGTGVCA